MNSQQTSVHELSVALAFFDPSALEIMPFKFSNQPSSVYFQEEG